MVKKLVADVDDLAERPLAGGEGATSPGWMAAVGNLFAADTASLALAELIPEAVVVHRGGKIVYGNSAAVRMLGADAADELLGRDLLDFVDSGDHGAILQRRRRASREGDRFPPQIRRYTRLDGSRFTGETSSVLLNAGDENIFLLIIRDITSRLDAGDALRESEEKYRDLYENAPDAYVSANPDDGAVLGFNKALIEMLGYEAAELSRMRVFDFYADTPDGRPLAVAQFKRLNKTGLPDEAELQMKRRDGEVIWVHLSLMQRRDGAGRVVENRGQLTDISDRKEAEAALRGSEESLRLITDNLPVHIAYIGSDQRYRFVNRAYENWYGEPRDRIIGLRISDIFGKRDYAAIRPHFERALKGETVEYEIDLSHRVTGAPSSRRNTYVPNFVDGRVEGVFVLSLDISTRRQAELSLKRSEEKYRDLFENAPNAYVSVNPRDGMVTGFNTAMIGLLGHQEDVLRKMNVDDIFADTPDGLPKARRAFERLRLGGEVREVELQMRCSTGWPIWVSMSITQHFDDAGESMEYRWIATDIMALKRAEKGLKLAKEEADIANRAKSEFLSSMSHELRTPLNGILGFAQLLQHLPDTPLDDRQTEYVDLIIRSGEQLRDLIDQVLELAKIETGELDVSLETVNAAEIVGDCLELLQVRADGRAITMKNLLSGVTLPHLHTDPMRLRQVLLNLVSNAVKYNREGGRVAVEAKNTGRGMLRISVADNGPGISDENLPGLFEPFNRLGQEVGNIEGTGIGLAITKKIVERLGGAIGLESQEGQGSTFWIDIPVSGGPLCDAETSPAPRAVPERLMLYAEDAPSNLRLMEGILGNLSNTAMLAAHTVDLAVDFAVERKPDIIFVDIDKDGVDGLAVIKALRATAATHDIPVIALTSVLPPVAEQRELAAELCQILCKPIQIPAFRRALDRALAE